MTRLEQISELADLQNRLLRAAEQVASEVRDLSFGCEDDDLDKDISGPIVKAIVDDLICYAINQIDSKFGSKIIAHPFQVNARLRGAN